MTPALARETTAVLARQIRGELRKLRHPLVALAITAIAAATCALQASHLDQPYPGPSIIDANGCLRIAFLQHATTLGFVLAGVLAAAGTADETGRGALAEALLQEPSRRRVAGVKMVAIMLGMLASVAVSTLALLLTRALLSAQGSAPPAVSRSAGRATLVDVSGALPALVLSAAVALALALATGSVIATTALTATTFYLPLTILQDKITWIAPTRWIIEWLHLDPLGAGVDYLANNSVYDHRGRAAIAGGLLITTAIAGLAVNIPRLVARAVTRPNERNA